MRRKMDEAIKDTILTLAAAAALFALALLLGGCARVRTRVVDLGDGHYVVTARGNLSATPEDEYERGVEEAKRFCAPRRAVLDLDVEGRGMVTAFRGGMMGRFHCEEQP